MRRLEVGGIPVESSPPSSLLHESEKQRLCGIWRENVQRFVPSTCVTLWSVELNGHISSQHPVTDLAGGVCGGHCDLVRLQLVGFYFYGTAFFFNPGCGCFPFFLNCLH